MFSTNGNQIFQSPNHVEVNLKLPMSLNRLMLYPCTLVLRKKLKWTRLKQAKQAAHISHIKTCTISVSFSTSVLVILCLLLLVSAGSSNYMVVELQYNRIGHGVWSQLQGHPIKAQPDKTQLGQNWLKNCVAGQHS